MLYVVTNGDKISDKIVARKSPYTDRKSASETAIEFALLSFQSL